MEGRGPSTLAFRASQRFVYRDFTETSDHCQADGGLCDVTVLRQKICSTNFSFGKRTAWLVEEIKGIMDLECQ